MLNLPPGITRMSELLSEGVSTTQEGQTRLTCVNEVHHNLHKADYNFDDLYVIQNMETGNNILPTLWLIVNFVLCNLAIKCTYIRVLTS